MQYLQTLETVKVVISKRGFGKDEARKEYYRRVEERKRNKKDLLNKKDKQSEKEE